MFWGAITEEVEGHARSMSNAADRLDSLGESLASPASDASIWTGPDADSFRYSALGEVIPRIGELAAMIRDLGTALSNEADEQNSASSDGSATGGDSLRGPAPFDPRSTLDGLPGPLKDWLERMEKSELPSKPPPRTASERLVDELTDREKRAADERKVLTEEDMAGIEENYKVARPDETEMKPWPAPPAPPLREQTSPEERRALDQIAVTDPTAIKRLKEIQNEAANQAEDHFGPVNEPAKDHQEDAFRHAYMNALATQHLGEERTERLYTAHEQIPAEGDPREDPRMAMDLHNNEVGRRIANQYPDATKEEMAKHIADAVRKGEMVILDPETGELKPSNQV